MELKLEVSGDRGRGDWLEPRRKAPGTDTLIVLTGPSCPITWLPQSLEGTESIINRSAGAAPYCDLGNTQCADWLVLK